MALKKEDGRFVMYDPTWVGNMRDIWSKYETEQEYLLGTPEGEGVRQIPYSPPEESMIKIISTGNILEDGTYRGTFKLQGNGVADSRLRRWLTRSEKGKLDVYLLEMLSGINERVELVGCQHGQLLNFNENMRFTIDFKIPEYALRIGDGYEFTSPMMKFAVAHLLAGGSRKWEKERKTDLFFYAASMVTGTETIGLPKGYQVADPAKSEEIDETYAYFKGDGKMANKRFVIRQTGKIKRRTIPPEGYDGFKQAMEEAQKYTETVFRAEKGEAK